MSEFDIIRRYFDWPATHDDVALAVGDDAALLMPPAGQCAAMTMDTLVSGVHFPTATTPQDLAVKVVAVNLSDLAAMGAVPASLLLSLTLPAVDHDWLRVFADSLRRCCEDNGVSLVGGDTTRGPLSITVQATGWVPASEAMRRDTAAPGDRVLVTGCLGDAALALTLLADTGTDPYLLQRLQQPQPRWQFAVALREVCRCAIDISDGLLADLGHILQASDCAADIDVSKLPLSAPYINHFNGSVTIASLRPALSGGDDYELCFCVPPSRLDAVMQLAARFDLAVTELGEIRQGEGIQLNGAAADVLAGLQAAPAGYNHFAAGG